MNYGDINSLGNVEIDILKEIGSIGAGNAATALASMLDRRVNMTVPSVQIKDFNELPELVGGAENLLVAVLLGMSGDLKGYIMFMLEERYASSLIEMLMGEPIAVPGEYNEVELSAIKEVSNILTGSYLAALGSLTGLTISASIPYLAIDMAGSILSVPSIQFGKVGDSALIVETAFQEREHTIVANFFLIPDVGTYEVLLKSLLGDLNG